jgi:hypothetical protein
VPVLIKGPADHVHALTTVPPTRALADVMRVLGSLPAFLPCHGVAYDPRHVWE